MQSINRKPSQANLLRLLRTRLRQDRPKTAGSQQIFQRHPKNRRRDARHDFPESVFPE